ncbi:MAG TPA: chordopoxvirus fusion protein [Candidatus Desulfofervidus auxilii]|uniref:Chordopoxvirus fusion protein n=1 Tax=Desulfofervidus auxilii TaxID=1621989 RepID=A0A7C1ZN35_DESA2|nr:chordopoxvirus fusion protein [Candidatus Desulfofervidus auxilii]
MIPAEVLEIIQKMPKEFREYFFHFTKVLYKDMVEIARKSDFEALKKNITELSKIVKELAAAQSKTEKRVEELAVAQSKTEARLEELAIKTEKRLEELAVAQSKTEKRLEELAIAQSKTEKRVEELAVAQSKTEARLEELAIAQSKTEKRLEELAAAQSKTEKRLEELAVAQSKTEDSLNKLINEHVETRRRLESMSDAVGYNLENQAYKALPALLEKDLKIKVEGKLVRRYFPGTRKGRYIQVNIYGWGAQNGKRILILGECKTSLSKKEVDRFLKLTKYIVKLENISEEETLKIAVVHDILPPVVSYLESKGIKLYWSYDL